MRSTSTSRLRLSAALLFAASLLVGACAPSTPAPETGAQGDAKAAALEARVAGLLKAAKTHESAVSKLLQGVAKAQGGSLVGFRHRLKTRRSLTRKIKLIISQGKAKTPAGVTINDALRYTLQVGDQPPGRYLQTVRSALRQLAAAGHGLLKLKNYWPRGDNYSGINSVLRTRDGLRWELQFHTPGSYEAQKATRAQYERLRARATPIAEKRALFDAMAKIWEGVPLPQGVLETTPVHPKAQRRKLPRP